MTGQQEQQVDVVVVGGGPAGLAGALALARARRSVLVVDAGDPRNARAEGAHNVLGHEGVAPAELAAVGRAEVARYGGVVRAGLVTGAEQLPGGGLRVRLGDGTAVRARRLLLATGLTDTLPDVPGLAPLWGRDVLHCPYCHGWEVRDRAVGVLASGPMAVHQALLWRQWTDRLTLLLHTGPEPDDAQEEQLAARGVEVVVGEVAAAESDGGRLTGVRLASGTRLALDALVVAPRPGPPEGLLAGLGLAVVDQEVAGAVVGRRVEAGLGGATAVPGVWAAGNLTDPFAGVAGSAAAGTTAGMALTGDLVAEDTSRAVAARRGGVFSAAGERAAHAVVSGARRHGLPAGR